MRTDTGRAEAFVILPTFYSLTSHGFDQRPAFLRRLGGDKSVDGG